MRRKIASVAILTAMALSAEAQTLTSPDGRLQVNVDCAEGTPCYSVVLDKDTVISRSPLGLNTTIGDFTHVLRLLGTTEAHQVTDSYSLNNAKKKDITYTANEQTWQFALADNTPAIDVTMRVDNSNVAFRYSVKGQKDRKACLVSNETTTYTFPEGTTTFLCPQMTPQTGFARTAPSYETFYSYDDTMGKNGHGRGYTFPSLFKVTAQQSDRKAGTSPYIWVMLSETGVGGNYCGSRLESTGSRSYGIAYPEETEFGGVGSSAPGLMLTGEKDELIHAETPWRTITVGRTLQALAETTIQWDLVAPQYEASQEYKYGRSAWSWIIRMDSSCNYDEQKEYIDFAAAMGWEYLLVDAWWDSAIGYERVEQLSRYAQSKGVGLFLWYNSNGYWNDAPQGPRGRMHRMLDRHREMAWMKKAGIKGIKVDFFGSDKQQTMQMYEDILVDANDYGLMVIFHGCTLQRGWERMYPNFVACEAIRASENLSFGQYDNDVEAVSASIHPVLRNAVGNVDFGGSALNKFYSTDNKRGKQRKTSDVFQLATSVLFQTPVQNFALAPNNMTDAPAWAVEYMKAVPTEWTDMRFIDGYPGKYVVMARKAKDGKWYVAAINAQEQPLALTLTLDMFAPGTELTVYSDNASLEGSKKPLKLNKKCQMKIVVPQNGGWLATE